MSDDYNDLYTVQQTADLLETNITNVYALSSNIVVSQ